MRPINSQSVLTKAEPFEPNRIGRYTVVQVYFEFSMEPADFKIFIVLKHEPSGVGWFCRCVKATTQIAFYEARPELLSGCVIYEIGQSIFPKRTAIAAHDFHNIAHSHFERYAKKQQFKIMGAMPSDFHQRFVKAILNSELLKPKDAKALLNAIGASELITAEDR